MRVTLKLRQSVPVSKWAVEGAAPEYDVYSAIQDRLLREALLETHKAHPGKVVTAINIVFLQPVYRRGVTKEGYLDEWYDCNTRTTVEIADSPEDGMFSESLTFL